MEYTTTSPAYAFRFKHTEVPRVRSNDKMMTGLPVIRLRDAYLHAITEDKCIDIVLDELDAGREGTIVTMNLDHMRRYRVDADYRALAAKATLHVADGMPLIWASRLQGNPLPERVTGSNLIWSLTEKAAERNRSIFLLGGEEGTAESASEILKQHFSDLEIAGTYCPKLGFENSEEEITKIANYIRESGPDIVYVALGSPKQDRLIEQLRDYLPAIWWIGVGISFSFVSGDVSRAPQWMQKFGLEWLHRLSQEPGRLFSRYIVHGLPYCFRLLASAFVHRFIKHPEWQDESA